MVSNPIVNLINASSYRISENMIRRNLSIIYIYSTMYWSSDSETILYKAKEGDVILETLINVTTAFNLGNPTASIGIGTDTLLGSDKVDLLTEGIYTKMNGLQITEAGNITLSLDRSSSGQGVFEISLILRRS